MRLFRPILAGATLRDRAIACLGALLGLGATGLVSRLILGAGDPAALLLVASMGASTVLLFVVPASPLTQPWPVVGGHVVAATVGVVVSHLIPDRMIAGGVAVSAAIAVMSLLRCLHPPGGGTALVPVVAGPVVAASGWSFILAPVALNAVLLLTSAWLFHRLISGHAYPHKAEVVPAGPATITEADIDAALTQLHEPLDVSREDLRAVAVLAAKNAAERTRRR